MFLFVSHFYVLALFILPIFLFLQDVIKVACSKLKLHNEHFQNSSGM